MRIHRIGLLFILIFSVPYTVSYGSLLQDLPEQEELDLLRAHNSNNQMETDLIKKFHQAIGNAEFAEAQLIVEQFQEINPAKGPLLQSRLDKKMALHNSKPSKKEQPPLAKDNVQLKQALEINTRLEKNNEELRQQISLLQRKIVSLREQILDDITLQKQRDTEFKNSLQTTENNLNEVIQNLRNELEQTRQSLENELAQTRNILKESEECNAQLKEIINTLQIAKSAVEATVQGAQEQARLATQHSNECDQKMRAAISHMEEVKREYLSIQNLFLTHERLHHEYKNRLTEAETRHQNELNQTKMLHQNQVNDLENAKRSIEQELYDAQDGLKNYVSTMQYIKNTLEIMNALPNTPKDFRRFARVVRYLADNPKTSIAEASDRTEP